MSDNTPFGFAKFVPGFDFLQNIAKGATNIPQLPNLSNWIAPTLNVEELEKRISELKAVHFWLDQNGKALGATIQALEVQKMTLATLQGMNFNMGEVANALKLKTAETLAGGVQKAGDPAGKVSGAAEALKRKAEAKAKPAAGSGNGAAAPVDPMQWWGALTQQFQEIAANAMKDVAQKTAVDTAKNLAAGVSRDPVKAAKKSAARKAPRKTARA
ncbi:MAG TPA: PhaM family polyhydroxyalkanoate granule multifunctional regulatory protein [Ramlibacter sp.]|uniref:PhaM family polyhydroxyalkanoate granule multifunctional regulatory protein n=1 Tax=Ramlibacter sp. TaxID=1917967 RepID=UPI002ED37183